jgi:hypothetical protein
LAAGDPILAPKRGDKLIVAKGWAPKVRMIFKGDPASSKLRFNATK